jgi:hypothetical protein
MAHLSPPLFLSPHPPHPSLPPPPLLPLAPTAAVDTLYGSRVSPPFRPFRKPWRTCLCWGTYFTTSTVQLTPPAFVNRVLVGVKADWPPALRFFVVVLPARLLDASVAG